jgi:hypothetical protein
MAKKSLLGVIMLSFLMMSSLLAITITHAQTGLKFDIPDDWEYSQEEKHFKATSPDESVVLLFNVGKANEIADLYDNIIQELSGRIENPEINGNVFEEEGDDLTIVYFEGTGESGSKIVDWALIMVFGGEKSMSIIALGNIKDMQSEINDIYTSVRK